MLRCGGPDGSRTASAARYPDRLCNAILTAVKNINKDGTPKDGGRRIPSFSLCEPDEFREMNKMEQIVLYLAPLRTVARDHGYEELFENLVDPWVNHHASGGNCSETRTGSTTSSAVALMPHQGMNDLVMNTLNSISITMTDLASSAKRLASFAEHQAEARAVKTPERPDFSSSPTAGPPRRESDSGDVGPLEEPPAEAEVGEAHDQGVAVPPDPPRELQDLLCGELPEEPWRHRRYSPDKWQSAEMRRRAHYRRSNVSLTLGVCTVDLSGPHEPSPRDRVSRSIGTP